MTQYRTLSHYDSVFIDMDTAVKLIEISSKVQNMCV